MKFEFIDRPINKNSNVTTTCYLKKMETVCKGCGCNAGGYILCDNCYYKDDDYEGDYFGGDNHGFVLHTNFMDVDSDDDFN